MKVLLVDERFFDFNLLRNCVGDGICSLLDIDMFVTGNEKSTPVQSLEPKPNKPAFSEASFDVSRRNQQQMILNQAKDYLDNHYMDFDCSLSSVAKSIHISPSYLSLIFKKVVGITFVNYLTLLRINKAKQLLSSTDLMVYEVSTSVGYENYSYFSTVFKKATGLSPREYRLNYHHKEEPCDLYF